VVSRGGGGSNRLECWDVRPAGALIPAWSLLDGKTITPDEPYLLHQAQWFSDAVALSADGQRVSTAECRPGRRRPGERTLLVLRDGATGQVLTELGPAGISFLRGWLALAPDGRALFAWEERAIQRWDVAAGRPAGQVPAPGRAYFRGLAAHPSGKVLLTASGDGQARFWDADTLSPAGALKWQVGKLHAVAFSPDGMLAAAGGDKGQVVVWDVDV